MKKSLLVGLSLIIIGLAISVLTLFVVAIYAVHYTVATSVIGVVIFAAGVVTSFRTSIMHRVVSPTKRVLIYSALSIVSLGVYWGILALLVNSFFRAIPVN